MDIGKFSVKNPVFVTMVMIALVIGGLIAFSRMPMELNPQINFNWVFITVVYPGAAPSETEALIVDPIEAEIQDVDDIDEIQSNAGEGFGFILVQFEDISDSEFRERMNDLKAEVDKVTLPDEAEDPVFESFGSSDFLPIITINMAYTIPEDNAQAIAEDFEDDLNDIPGVGKVQVSGLAKREIWIEMNPEKMNSYGVTFEQVVMALKMRNLNVPGGTISFGKSEYLIRSLGEYQSVDEIANTVVRTSPRGDFIKIKDVAKVNDTREEMPILSRMNGKTSITFSMSKNSDANSIDVIDRIKALVREYEQRIPDGVTLSESNDNSVYIMRVINILGGNALFGMALVIVLLYFFMGKWNAILAAIGIPLSFLITFIFMYMNGSTLNGNTLFALVMVVGIIVDDAIVILENCHRYRMMGYSAHDAAISGTNEVIAPVFSSIITNIAAFIPLMLLPGLMGKFMRLIPIVYTLALLASMLEAFFLLPSHYADWTRKSRAHLRGEPKLLKWLRPAYGRLLVKTLRRRYIILPLLVVILFISFALIPLIGVEMFAEEDFDQFRVLIKMPEGTSLQESDRIVRKFEAVAEEMPKSAVQDYIVNVGLMQGNNEWKTSKSVAQILFQLYPIEERDLSTPELIAMMREKIKHISGPTFVQFEMMSGGPPVGKSIAVKVQGRYLEDIKKASLALQDSLRGMKGAYDIGDDYPPGKQEIRIAVDEEKAALQGFTAQYVAMNVRYAFDGADATELREGDEEIDVIVKYDVKNRSSINDVLNLRLTNPLGQTVPLSDIVKFEIRQGYDQINRFDQKRTIMVTGEIDKEQISLDQINNQLAQIFPKMEKQFPGVSFEIGGQFEEFMNVFQDISALFAIGILLIFLILATQFKSYIQPLIIMTTVPFSFIGAMLGLIISGNPFSIVSLFGFTALAGIVVNDAIVMINFINKYRGESGLTKFRIWRSIIDSGMLRLRPIILTSITTIGGLMPMAFGIGGMSQMWSPLANVIVWGLLISTMLTLFVIPSFVAIVDDMKKLRKRAVVVER